METALLHQYHEILDTQGFSINIANEKPLIYEASVILVQQSLWKLYVISAVQA